MQRMKIYTLTRPMRSYVPIKGWIPAKIKKCFGCRRDRADDEEILLPEVNGNDLQVTDPNLDYFQNNVDVFKFFKRFCVTRNFYGAVAFVLAVSFLVVGSGTYVGKIMRTSAKTAALKSTNSSLATENITAAALGHAAEISDENRTGNKLGNGIVKGHNLVRANMKRRIPRKRLIKPKNKFENAEEIGNDEKYVPKALENKLFTANQAKSHVVKHDLERQVRDDLFFDIMLGVDSKSVELSGENAASSETDESKSDEVLIRQKRVAESESTELALDFSNDTATIGEYPGDIQDDENPTEDENPKKKRSADREVDAIAKYVNPTKGKRYLIEHERNVNISYIFPYLSKYLKKEEVDSDDNIAPKVL